MADPKLPFKVGEYADEIVDAEGRQVLEIRGGTWVCEQKRIVLSPSELALRDFVIEACNKFGVMREVFQGDTITSLQQIVEEVEGKC